MFENAHVRSDGHGRFGLYKDDKLLVANLDLEDLIALNCNPETSGDVTSEPPSPARSDQRAKTGGGALDGKSAGRPLILEPYLELIRDMLNGDPSLKLKDIESRLNNLGIRFSSITAVTNLIRKHGL